MAGADVVRGARNSQAPARVNTTTPVTPAASSRPFHRSDGGARPLSVCLPQRNRGRDDAVVPGKDLDRRDQPVTAPGDGFDDARLPGIVLEQAAQLGHRTGEDIVGDGGVGPGGLEQLVLRHHPAGALRQADQDQHHLGFEAAHATRTGHAVERRLDLIGPADPKAILQGAASVKRQRNRSTATSMGIQTWGTDQRRRYFRPSARYRSSVSREYQ